MKLLYKNKTLLCAALIIALMLSSPLAVVKVNAVTQDEIDDVQQQLDLLDEQIQAQQEVINALVENKGLMVDRKLAMDKKISLTMEQINLITSQIELYDEMIAEQGAELEEAMAAENAQAELLRERMRTMEENGNYSYISFIFEADSFADLLGRIADVNDIMHFDQNLEASYMAAREDVEAIKRTYEEYQLEQENLNKELEAKRTELDSMTEAALQLIAMIDENSENAQAEYDAIAAVREETEAELRALIKKREEEEAARRAAEAAAAAAAAASGGGGGGTSSGGGGAVSLSSLMWPVPSCSLITSRFGYRSSPTAGASSYHGGLDIGAGAGSTIVAAQSGTVILASANGGYGNCVMIDHGGGIITLYGHMQSIAVSYGQNVSRGQTIGYVGSTGISTGPHCHFEIRINGAQTDPAPYFSGLSYWNC